ncbi:HeH/LEM domain-containing protein [Azotobacter beijerinckii]|uniref:HeH/LEM domain-containing protein n=1 Tax=Azotobacter beijerinckii TaxID=170623 RepID=UPI002955991B|nr:HeH/LEM domain-containing protein [Azotobacter beijerinckii]MDV7209910.1 HeH/LEM domain-containing protein [Azotobacter beijerinckii]
MTEQKIIYEPHPVAPERKAELRAQGFKILDARFRPAPSLREDGPTVGEWVAAGYLAANYPPEGYASCSSAEEIAEAVVAQGADTCGDGKLSIAEIRDALTAKDIEFDPKAKKADLLALLEQAGG